MVPVRKWTTEGTHRDLYRDESQDVSLDGPHESVADRF